MRISQGIGVRGGLMRRWIWMAATCVVLAGCGARTDPQSVSVSSARRVICGTPAVAEIVFALGCGNRVVGVSEFTDWPEEAASVPRIGSALTPHRESILRLNPDLILSQGKSEALEKVARSQGVGFLSFPLDTLADLRAAITGFAMVLGVEEQGRILLERMEKDFADIPACRSVSVFIALGHAPGDLSGLMTSGPGTFLNELVSKAGGSNIFSDVNTLWPKISQESLIRRQPSLLLDFQPGPMEEERRAALLDDWVKLGFQEGQVRLLTEEFLLKPGPRAAQSVACLAQAICKNGF